MPSIRYTYGTDYDPLSSNEILLLIYGTDQSSYFFQAYDDITEPRVGVIIANLTEQDSQREFYYSQNISFAVDFSDNAGDITIIGYNFNDVIRGGSGNDQLRGYDGDDILDGGAGINNLFGGAGNDVLTGGADGDDLAGNEGNDTLRGMGGADTLLGGEGNDRLVITGTPTLVDGGENIDLLFVSGIDPSAPILLTDGNFTGIEKVYVRDDTLLDMSGVGTDLDSVGSVIISQSKAEHGLEIYGTQDADTITAGKGGDVIFGGDGNDVFKGGGTGSARLSGDNGDDRITIGIGGGTAIGGSGNDTIIFSTGRISAEGGDGNDTIKVGISERAAIRGGANNDRISTDAEITLIDGGNGADKIFLGLGEDYLFFSNNFNRDEIYNFDLSKDTLVVSAFASDLTGLKLTSVHGGADTLITFVSDPDPTDKIVLHGIAKADLITDGQFRFASDPADSALLIA